MPAPGTYEKLFLGGVCSIPDFHHGVYESEPGYTFSDWSQYRNANYRTRPEPIVLIRVLSGFWLHMLLVAVISGFVGIYFHYCVPLGAPDISTSSSSLLSVATFFLSLLLVFRLNQAYSRWWEARTQWGSNLAVMRTYMILVMTWAHPGNRRVWEAALRWTPAAMILLKEYVREGENSAVAVQGLLLPHEIEFLSHHFNKPLAAARVLTQLAVDLKCPSPILMAQMQEQVGHYIMYMSGNERILRTPLPTGYTRFTCRACMMYICILPLLLWPVSGWLTPLVAVIIAFMVMGIENVTVQIEEPMRALHLDSLCKATEKAAEDLRAWHGPAVTDMLALGSGADHNPDFDMGNKSNHEHNDLDVKLAAPADPSLSTSDRLMYPGATLINGAAAV